MIVTNNNGNASCPAKTDTRPCNTQSCTPSSAITYSIAAGTLTTASADAGLWTYGAISDDGLYVMKPASYGKVNNGTIDWFSDTGGNSAQTAMSSNGKYAISTINDNRYGNYFYTTDNGQTWTAATKPGRYFACCTNIDGRIMIANGDEQTGTWVTTNSGVSWTNYNSFNSYNFVPGYSGQHTGWAVSDDGTYMLRTPYSMGSYFWTSNSGVGNFGTGWVTRGDVMGIPVKGRYESCSMSGNGQYQVVNGKTIDGVSVQNFISSDYGQTWNQLSNYYSLYITRDGTKLFSQNNVSHDFGKTWYQIPSLKLGGMGYIFSANAKYVFYMNYDFTINKEVYSIQKLIKDSSTA
jgi:hypothetical protein